MRIVVAGGGWAGCAAALSARKQGADVVLLERTDMLLGTGLVGGIMRNNGRFTATEELIAMAGGEIFQVIDNNLLHKNIEFPGHHHASLYNVATMEPLIKTFLAESGLKIHTATRVTDVEMKADRILAVSAKQLKKAIRFEGDAFIDTTGTAGPPANCTKYGNGCAMCVLRCHSFGGRVSLAGKAGCKEMNGEKNGQIGAFSGSCKLHKESLSKAIRDRLNGHGVAVVPLGEAQKVKGKLALKACQQYAIAAFEENVVLLDTGHAKLMSPFFPLDLLRTIPGFEHARYEDPYAGGIGNSVRYFDMSPRDDTLKVAGVENLFCAGEKAGLLVGHTEAICTGTLAGYNAAQYAKGRALTTLPDSLAIGDAIRHVREQMVEKRERGLKYTFSGSVYFDRMTALGLYSTDKLAIAKRVKAAGVGGIFQS
ncbi:FAD-dependent oxidoreductase [Desulfosarcina sp.]|uniref:FAD-dependent oxidoreductase n=1 Tax=Desulfosarcina sp. TaxID=2027861 RepID=UPI0039708A90